MSMQMQKCITTVWRVALVGIAVVALIVGEGVDTAWAQCIANLETFSCTITAGRSTAVPCSPETVTFCIAYAGKGGFTGVTMVGDCFFGHNFSYNDVMSAAPFGPDVIYGGEGDDDICARGGNDIVSGGPGNDRILGGSGDDVISGDEGNDVLFSEFGNDIIFGGGAFDLINCGPGNDTAIGGDGLDGIGNCEIVID